MSVISHVTLHSLILAQKIKPCDRMPCIEQQAELTPPPNPRYVSSDHLKAIAYSAADLFIFPTRADNLPLVLQESMACGTPMVSFNIGGVPDLVRPGETGYLAAPEDTTDFRNGIIELLEDSALRHQMAENCRTIALAEYTIEQQADRYIALYQGLLR
jgi:glycosyltransferase involved in cell wall biosynthesis